MSAARTVTILEDAGIAGLHLEDQINPKRCGHLDGKAIVPTEDMVRRVRAAVSARRDPNFVICARTDAAGIDGIDAAIERAKAYADAGADLIFTEALADRSRLREVPRRGRHSAAGQHDRVRQVRICISAKTLEEIGYNAVIYPVTTLAAGDVRRRKRSA